MKITEMRSQVMDVLYRLYQREGFDGLMNENDLVKLVPGGFSRSHVRSILTTLEDEGLARRGETMPAEDDWQLTPDGVEAIEMDSTPQIPLRLDQRKPDRIFISWSGDSSKAVAGELRTWLPLVHQSFKPWMSAQDILAGSFWHDELRKALSACSFCILCITRDALSSAWLNYEAGWIGDRVGVCPYLIDVSISELSGHPLHLLQAVSADREGTAGLLRALYATCAEPMEADALERVLNSHWSRLGAVLDAAREKVTQETPRPEDKRLADVDAMPLADDWLAQLESEINWSRPMAGNIVMRKPLVTLTDRLAANRFRDLVRGRHEELGIVEISQPNGELVVVAFNRHDRRAGR